jgi:hypothetical protein
MASLDKNSLWSELENDASDVTTDVMGPSYSYADNVIGPAYLGVGSQPTIGQLFTNTGAIIDYVNYMVSGPALGNQYFVNTGGTCIAPDKSTQSRYNFINNLASGDDTLPEDMKVALAGIASDFNGLIPGMLEDIEGLNPLNLFTAIAADSTPTCECYTCPTQYGYQSRFLNTDLTPDFDPTVCALETDLTKCANPPPAPPDPNQRKKKGKEGFGEADMPYMPLALAVGVLALLHVF